MQASETGILVNAAASTEVVQDVGRMGCTGLYYVTLDIDDVEIVEEAFSKRTPSQFNDLRFKGSRISVRRATGG